MKKFMSLFLLIILIGCHLHSSELIWKSPLIEQTHEELIQKYIKLSGIEHMLQSIPNHFDDMSNGNHIFLKNQDIDPLVIDIMKNTYDLEIAKKRLNNFLINNTNKSYLKEIISWLESPLAKKITQKEIQATGPDMQIEMRRYFSDLQFNPPKPSRIKLIHDLIEAAHITELTTTMIIDISHVIFDSFNLAIPREARIPEETINNELNKMRLLLQDALHEQTILLTFYTYKEISNKELRKYIQFYKSNLGQKNCIISGKAISFVLREWFIDIAYGINKLVIEPRETI